MDEDTEEILALMDALEAQYKDTDNNFRAFAMYWRSRALIDMRDRLREAADELEEVAA